MHIAPAPIFTSTTHRAVQAAAPSVARPAARRDAIADVVESWRARHGVTGIIASVRQHGAAVADVAAGVRALDSDGRQQLLAPTDTMYAASITKLLAAGITLRAAGRGQLRLDEHVANWRTDVTDGERISVTDLLDHRSGIEGYVSTPEFQHDLAAAPGVAWPAGKALQVGLAQPRSFAPGAGFSYSNTNYLLVQDLLERRTGASFADLVQRELVTPLGLDARATYMSTPAGSDTASAVGHQRADGRITDTQALYTPGSLLRSVIGADGGVITTAAQLAAIGEGLLSRTGALLNDAEHTQLIASADTAPQNSYGLGVARWDLPPAVSSSARAPMRAYGHAGGIPGYASLLLHVPESDVTVALLSNDAAASADLAELAAALIAATGARS